MRRVETSAEVVPGELICSALVRHVSPDGCQLIVESARIGPDMRIALRLDPRLRIAGVVRWRTENRAGFAFDAPLSSELGMAMQADHPLPTRVEILAI